MAPPVVGERRRDIERTNWGMLPGDTRVNCWKMPCVSLAHVGGAQKEDKLDENGTSNRAEGETNLRTVKPTKKKKP